MPKLQIFFSAAMQVANFEKMFDIRCISGYNKRVPKLPKQIREKRIDALRFFAHKGSIRTRPMETIKQRVL